MKTKLSPKTLLGLQGAVQEMLLYSDDSRIELLPALPREWRRGTALGLRLRCGGVVEKLQWDLDAGWVMLDFTLTQDRTLVIRVCDGPKSRLTIDSAKGSPARNEKGQYTLRLPIV